MLLIVFPTEVSLHFSKHKYWSYAASDAFVSEEWVNHILFQASWREQMKLIPLPEHRDAVCHHSDTEAKMCVGGVCVQGHAHAHRIPPGWYTHIGPDVDIFTAVLQTYAIVNHRAFDDNTNVIALLVLAFRDIQHVGFQGPSLSKLVIMANSWACCPKAPYEFLINMPSYIKTACSDRL